MDFTATTNRNWLLRAMMADDKSVLRTEYVGNNTESEKYEISNYVQST